MVELIHDLPLVVRDEAGKRYRASVHGSARADGFWDGWLRFAAEDGTTLRTEHDTLQRSRDDLLVWATGLEPTYLDGAFERARHPLPSAAPAGTPKQAP